MKKIIIFSFIILCIAVFLTFLFSCTSPVERIRIVEISKDAEKQNEKELAEESSGTELKSDSENEQASGEGAGSDSESDSSLEGGNENESENQNQTETEQGSDKQTEPETEVESEPGPKTEPEPEPEQDPEPEPEPELEPEPEPEPELTPDPMQEMPDPPKMTLVVYMAADNDLESYAIQNLKAMEHADFNKMNVLVLLDRSEGFDETNGDWTDTRLFELTHDSSDSNLILSKRISCPPLGLSNKVETELDMGNPSVLWNLLNFARNNYEAEKLALIIWGHGSGWRYSSLSTDIYEKSNSPGEVRAVAIDDRSGSYMSVHDLGRALRNQGLSVIGFDTCFGGVFENVYELKNHSEYTVASPGVTPSSGWNYKALLEDLSNSYFSAKEIAEIMADASLVNTTIFNNSKLYSLMNDIEDFSKALAAIIKSSAIRNNVYSKLSAGKSYCYTQYPCDLYLDIYSMAEAYKSNSDSNLATAAKKLQKSVNAAAKTENAVNAEIGIHFIPKISSTSTAVSHSVDYIKDVDNADQCMFIKESQGWVPTREGDSESLLDKLFYTSF